MSRSLDWKIHELLGNDLTGFNWGMTGSSAFQLHDSGVKWIDIPQYSSTPEGLVTLLTLIQEITDHSNYIFKIELSGGYFVEVGMVLYDAPLFECNGMDLNEGVAKAFIWIKEQELST